MTPDYNLIVDDNMLSWRTLIRSMLARAGVDGDYASRLISSRTAQVPPGACEYLISSNQRLIDLIRRYSALGLGCVQHSRWSTSYVDRDVPLLNFRGDSAFVWQHRDLNLPVNYVLTYLSLSLEHKLLLNDLSEDELFGPYAVSFAGECLTRDRMDSVSEILFLERHLHLSKRPRVHLLDIGAGYGRFAYRLVQAFNNVTVTCIDAIPQSTFICEYYLAFRGVQSRVRTMSLDDLGPNLDFPVDVAVNIHSFSECTMTAIKWWIDLLKQAKVSYVMIVPNASQHGGKRLTCCESDGSRMEYEHLIEEAGYRRVVLEPKYSDPVIQRFGISPTHYHLFRFS